MSKIIKKLTLFLILNFNLFAGEKLVSIGDLVVSIPDGHEYQTEVSGSAPSPSRVCFNNFLQNRVSEISVTENGPSVFQQLNDLGYYTEIRLGRRDASTVGSDEQSFSMFSFAMRDLGENWCDQAKQNRLFIKIKREILAKLNSVLGRRLVTSLGELNENQNLEDCDCVNFSEFKFNEEAGTVFYPNRTQVRNSQLLSKLFKFFYNERSEGRTGHIIAGTELLEILGGRECLVRRYKRDEQGALVLDYCTPKGPSLSSASTTDSEEPAASEQPASEESTGKKEGASTLKEIITTEEDQGSVSKSGDDYAAAEIERQMGLIRSLEKKLSSAQIDEGVTDGLYEKLHEQLSEIDVQQFSEGENGEVFDQNGKLIHNETLIERYYDETSPPDEDEELAIFAGAQDVEISPDSQVDLDDSDIEAESTEEESNVQEEVEDDGDESNPLEDEDDNSGTSDEEEILEED